MTPLKPLLYFSLFRYPLTLEEIFAFSESDSKESLHRELKDLVKDSVVYNIDGFYSCENDEYLIERRLKGNEGAKQIFTKTDKVSRFISRFPYVEGVAVSGSLSKGYFDEEGDIDFFIITTPKRLWIARTLLILYKKLFLLNSRKYFCVNYFISADSLEIQEKNRFTATELVTMIPMYGNGSFGELYEKNKWAYQILPNKEFAEGMLGLKPVEKPRLTRGLEKLLNTRLGDAVDNFFLRITHKKWRAKFNNMDRKSFDVAMKSTKEVSKHHPQNFQKKVIDRLNEKYQEYQEKYNIHLPKEHA
ncbi:nucleotidyltransferase domain-containing protein [Aureisphaera galaxeae]|uniref:nucleotidyltransferase domain-containing protein n=1 Tax=Aureisphaera galaxeae TaxID=1538023 RepID=UPI002350B3F1|nr:nucleotidyltransferase domain-containing protein [Aureisphaera galaxeae]MDC8005758.1 nucleotidyltransferase domain-containing protein [Aureisphaera galaxeae]